MSPETGGIMRRENMFLVATADSPIIWGGFLPSLNTTPNP